MDLYRGAQRYAAGLRAALDGPDQRHRTVTLFESEPAALRPDVSLGAPDGPARRFGFDPRAALRLRRFLRQVRPAAVVAHGSEPLKYVAAAAPAGTPIVYYRIGVAHTRLQGRLRSRLARLSMRRVTVTAAVSDDAAADAGIGARLERQQVVVIPNGRDAETYRPRHPAGRATVRIMFVGHLTATKRPHLFLDVIEDLRRQGLVFEAAMVGDGPLLGEIRARGAALDVDVMGRRSDLPELLGAADMLLFTSTTEGEGMPGVLIEAGLSGVPVVSTAVPGAAAVVQHDVTGFVVGPDDHAGLVHHAALLMGDAARRESMGAAARTHCARTFSMEASSAAWRDLLGGLVGGPAPARR